jgi:hypothetical protein
MCLQLLDGRVSLHDVEVLRPSPAASHPYLSPQQHPDLLAEAVSCFSTLVHDLMAFNSSCSSSSASPMSIGSNT